MYVGFVCTVCNFGRFKVRTRLSEKVVGILLLLLHNIWSHNIATPQSIINGLKKALIADLFESMCLIFSIIFYITSLY